MKADNKEKAKQDSWSYSDIESSSVVSVSLLNSRMRKWYLVWPCLIGGSRLIWNTPSTTVTGSGNITLNYSDKCFGELQSLYIVGDYKRYRTDEFSAGVWKRVMM